MQLIEPLFDHSSLQFLAGGEELARLDAVARLLRRRRHQLVLHLGQPELELLQRSEFYLLEVHNPLIGTFPFEWLSESITEAGCTCPTLMMSLTLAILSVVRLDLSRRLIQTDFAHLPRRLQCAEHMASIRGCQVTKTETRREGVDPRGRASAGDFPNAGNHMRTPSPRMITGMTRCTSLECK